MSLPRHVSPAARARRALLLDVLAGLSLTLVVLLVSAGIGVVGFAGLLTAVVLTAWIAVERLGLALYRRRRGRRRRSARVGSGTRSGV